MARWNKKALLGVGEQIWRLILYAREFVKYFFVIYFSFVYLYFDPMGVNSLDPVGSSFFIYVLYSLSDLVVFLFVTFYVYILMYIPFWCYVVFIF